ncbi:43kDa postsynaptic protein [Artemisia annua]|uniref:43kDa postsynaptic protein n=1 Tax=Artemisia annua TaxID=35608 RepID=A0A2U1PSA7_ARTAN|nr:43kDa postsynaptic protein [Artemisia annua]
MDPESSAHPQVMRRSFGYVVVRWLTMMRGKRCMVKLKVNGDYQYKIDNNKNKAEMGDVRVLEWGFRLLHLGAELGSEMHQGDQGDALDAGRSSHLYDLMKRGNKAFRDDRYEELALKDAEQFMNFQNNSAMAYVLKANALILLEKFELARDVIRTGLQIDGSRAGSSSQYILRRGGLQLSATPATSYYLNPEVPEADHIRWL